MQSKVIGVTGHTGSGTSQVSNILASYGCQVLSADKIVHEILLTDKKVIEKISNLFSGVLNEDGSINRKVLGQKVFGAENKENLKMLENIIHPAVGEKIKNFIAKNNSQTVILDVPLLFESGLNSVCNHTIFVNAEYEIRLRRIIKRDDLTHDQAEKRINSREAADLNQVDFVIDNNGNLDDLAKNVANVYNKIFY